MNFRQWFYNKNESIDRKAEKIFSRRNFNENLEFNLILKSLNLPETNNEPVRIGFGSMSNVYLNPHNPNQVIKVTGDFSDAKNFNKILKRNITLSNLPKVYNVVKINNKAAAILLDYIKGKKMPYNSNELHALINGDYWADSSEAIKEIQSGKIGKIRKKIIEMKGKNVAEESQKLIRLFDTLAKLESIGINIFDFNEDNIKDNGKDYVIVDLGL